MSPFRQRLSGRPHVRGPWIPPLCWAQLGHHPWKHLQDGLSLPVSPASEVLSSPAPLTPWLSHLAIPSLRDAESYLVLPPVGLWYQSPEGAGGSPLPSSRVPLVPLILYLSLTCGVTASMLRLYLIASIVCSTQGNLGFNSC